MSSERDARFGFVEANAVGGSLIWDWTRGCVYSDVRCRFGDCIALLASAVRELPCAFHYDADVPTGFGTEDLGAGWTLVVMDCFEFLLTLRLHGFGRDCRLKSCSILCRQDGILQLDLTTKLAGAW